MLRFAADENFYGDIVRGVLRRGSQIDILRVQDIGLSGADDPSVLPDLARRVQPRPGVEWACALPPSPKGAQENVQSDPAA